MTYATKLSKQDEPIASAQNLNEVMTLEQPKTQDQQEQSASRAIHANAADSRTADRKAAKIKKAKKPLSEHPYNDVTSWLGHNILVPGQTAVPTGFGQYAGEFILDTPSPDLSIDFLNNCGEIVQAIEMGPQEPGRIIFQWDAMDARGYPLPLGPLRVRVNGGHTAGLSTWTMVESIEKHENPAKTRLITKRGIFTLADALRFN